MPAEYKVGGGVPKAVLRRSMRGLVPDRILDRKDKMGFVTAEKEWLKSHMKLKFRQGVEASLERFPGLLDPSILAKFDAAAEGSGSFDFRYWRVINLGCWARAFNIRA
jgi:asparagine synthase (glutamine-hydrolysing)